MTDVAAPIVDQGFDPLPVQYFLQIAQCSVTLILPWTSAAAHYYKRAVVFEDPGVVLRHIGKKAFHRIVIESAVHPPVVITGGVVNAR